jgi:hypothetical protein
MLAPEVALLRLTDCAAVYVPALGEKVGAAALIVYAAVATLLSSQSAL